MLFCNFIWTQTGEESLIFFVFVSQMQWLFTDLKPLFYECKTSASAAPTAHLCPRRTCFQGWVCPAGGRSWSDCFCLGLPADGPLSSGRFRTAGSHRAADARSDLTGGRLHAHTRQTHTHKAWQPKGERRKAEIKDHYSRHAEWVCLSLV